MASVPSISFHPARYVTDGPETRLSPVLKVHDLPKIALPALKVWINGVDVTGRLAELAELDEHDGLNLNFAELNFGPGVHHLRASVPDEAGLAVADAFVEVAGAKSPRAVKNAEGKQVVAKKKCKCCEGGGGDDGGGGENGGNGNGGNGDGGGQRECDKMQGGEPSDEDEGDTPEHGDDPGELKCRVRHINLDPGATVSADAEKVEIEVLAEPADACIEFSGEVRVRYEVPPSLMFNYTDKTIDNLTRADLARQRGARVFRVGTVGALFHRLTGPRKAEVLISQIDRQTRAAFGGVAFQCAIGVRCCDGRWITVVIGVHDPS